MPVPARTTSPYAKLQRVGEGEVKWTKGFWAEEFDRCHKEVVNMWQLLKSDRSNAWNNFLVAAGKKEGDHHGPRWHDGDFYKWMEAVSHVYAVTADAGLDRLLEEIIPVIAAAQRADGYIHTPVIIRHDRLGRPDVLPFGDRMDFEMYNMGHLMTAACTHWQATGKTSLLDIAIKAADFLCGVFKNPTVELARNSVCPSHYMGLIDLYRTTGKAKYLELAGKLVEMRALMAGGGDDNQDRLPLRQQEEILGHAVRANYLFAGVADLYAETGDATLLEPLHRCWEDLVSRKMHITGGCGALFDGASPDGAKDQKVITRVHQAYGRPFQLPNVTSHNETCANIGNALWNWRMLAITGEARFADIIELVLHNSALAGISLDGESFFYTNPLRTVQDLPFELRWSRVRQRYISSFCCPPNIVRIIASANNWAYSLSQEGLWVNLYGGNSLVSKLPSGGTLKVTQETRYPWDGLVKLAIQQCPAEAFDVFLRIPAWADGASVKVNGRAADAEVKPGTYAAISRTWRAGDAIELNLPMKVELVEAHPLVEEDRNQVAVRRGPLVYCLESVDLPAGVKLDNVVIPADITLSPRVETNFAGVLSELVVLEGQAEAVESPEWGEKLYRPFKFAPIKKIPVKLVPYFAWGNRGVGDMSVWLPVRL